MAGLGELVTGEHRTLDSPLWTAECLACAWVRLTKSAISKVDRIILVCFPKSPKHSSSGGLACNLFSAEPNYLRWEVLNIFGWVCLNVKIYLFATRIKFSFKMSPLICVLWLYSAIDSLVTSLPFMAKLCGANYKSSTSLSFFTGYLSHRCWYYARAHAHAHTGSLTLANDKFIDFSYSFFFNCKSVYPH